MNSQVGTQSFQTKGQQILGSGLFFIPFIIGMMQIPILWPAVASRPDFGGHRPPEPPQASSRSLSHSTKNI